MSKLSNDLLIKAAVERLNERGGSDWQSLMKSVGGRVRPLEYNYAQLLTHVAIQRHKTVSNIWGRGTGKTTSLGDTLKQLVASMPRAVGAFVAPTYQFFLTRIIPSLVQGLEMQGLYQNLHYFVGRRPPKSWNWPEPYQPPLKYDHFVIFFNGFGFHLVSQDIPGDGRGLNIDFVLTDESALLDKQKLDETVAPALRGSSKVFERSPFWGLTVHHTSMPVTAKGRWLFDLEEAQREDPRLKTIMADARLNAHNLMPGYLESEKSKTLPWLYEAEYLNIRPRQVENGFYALLDERAHGYVNYNYSFWSKPGQKGDCRGDSDLVPERPLVLGVDWGVVIASLVATQSVPGELRALKSMFVLADNRETQEDLAAHFCDYYQYHPTKQVYLWYDHTGNIRSTDARLTKAEQFALHLRQRGWVVQLMTRGGRNPEHEKKQYVWERILCEDDASLPRFRCNTMNARDLWTSMSNAQVIRGSSGEIKKDKGSERRKGANARRQEATDLSDALDTVVFGMFADIVDRGTSFFPDR